MWKRSVKYWGKICLENMGICMALALMLMIFVAAESFDYVEEGVFGGLKASCVLYPYYLILAGEIYLVIGTVSYFQAYLPMLLSMNATRRHAVLGIIFQSAVMILGIAVLTMVVGLLPLGDDRMPAEYFPVLTGLMLLTGAVGIVMGVVSVRWGKIGRIIVMLAATAMGGFCGAGVVLLGKDKAGVILKVLMDAKFVWLVVIGAVVYVLAGAFALAVTRKIEVRM